MSPEPLVIDTLEKATFLLTDCELDDERRERIARRISRAIARSVRATLINAGAKESA